MTIKVAVRHRNGGINHYTVSGVDTWSEARNHVVSQVPTARAVLALVEGGDRRAPVVPSGKLAA